MVLIWSLQASITQYEKWEDFSGSGGQKLVKKVEVLHHEDRRGNPFPKLIYCRWTTGRHEREEGSFSNAHYRNAMVKLENCISIFNQIHFALESAFLSLEKRQGFQSFWIFKVSNARLHKWIIFSKCELFSAQSSSSPRSLRPGPRMFSLAKFACFARMLA